MKPKKDEMSELPMLSLEWELSGEARSVFIIWQDSKVKANSNRIINGGWPRCLSDALSESKLSLDTQQGFEPD